MKRTCQIKSRIDYQNLLYFVLQLVPGPNMDFMRLSSPLPFMHETVGGDFKSPRTVNSLLIVVIIFCLEVGGGETRR